MKKYGARISINPDAHHIEGMGDMAFGVGIARKGWIRAEEVINTLSLSSLRKLLGK